MQSHFAILLSFPDQVQRLLARVLWDGSSQAASTFVIASR